MSEEIIKQFLEDHTAFAKVARDAVGKISRDFSEEDIENITGTAWEKAWRNRRSFLGKSNAVPSTWCWKIAKNAARDHLRKNRPQKSSGWELEKHEDREAYENLQQTGEGLSTEKAFELMTKFGLVHEEDRLFSIGRGIAGQEEPEYERELFRIIDEGTCLNSAYLTASRTGDESKKNERLKRLRSYNDRNYGIPDAYLGATCGDWDAIKFMVALFPNLLLADYDGRGLFKGIRDHILDKLHGLVTRADHSGRKLNDEIDDLKKTFASLYTRDHHHRVSPVALKFLVDSFEKLYGVEVVIPFQLSGENPRLPDSLEELWNKMIENDGGEAWEIIYRKATGEIVQATQKTSSLSNYEPEPMIPGGKSVQIDMGPIWQRYAEEHPEKYGNKATSTAMAYHMTSKATGMSEATIRRHIKTLD